MSPNNHKEAFQQMRIMHYALVAGVLLFCTIAYFLGENATIQPNQSLSKIFIIIAPAAIATAILAASFLGKQRFKQAKSINDLTAQVAAYRTTMIIRWAIIEGSTFLTILGFLITANNNLLLIALAAVAYLFTLRPTPEHLAASLELSEGEYQQLKQNSL